MNAFGQYPSGLICGFIHQLQIVKGQTACLHFYAKSLLIIFGKIQLNGCGIEYHPLNGKFTLNTFICFVRMHSPCLIGAEFLVSGKVCGAELPVSTGKHFEFTLKSVERNHQIQGHFRQRKCCGPFNGLTSNLDVL